MDVAKELRPPGRVGVAIGRAGEMELQPLEQQQEGAEQIWDAGSPEGGLSSSEDGGGSSSPSWWDETSGLSSNGGGGEDFASLSYQDDGSDYGSDTFPMGADGEPQFEPPPVAADGDASGLAAAPAAAAPAAAAPAAAAPAATRKRPRGGGADAAAMDPLPLPPHEGTSHQAGGYTWCGLVPSSLGDMSYARCAQIPVPFEIAAHLLSYADALVSGPRPQFLDGSAETAQGLLFKDSVERRANGSDRFVFKGGPQNYATSRVLGTTADGRPVAVRRAYGKVVASRIASRGAAAEAQLRVHQYALVAMSKGGKAGKDELMQPHLYHIVGVADDAASTRSKPVKEDPSARSVSLSGGGGGGGGGSSGDRSGRGRAGNRREALMDTPEGAGAGAGGGSSGGGGGGASGGGGAGRDGLTVDGLLTLKQPSAKAPWIVFHDRQGDAVGKIAPSRGGVKLSSGSGDFAEWHVRAPDEKPFEAGEVVSIQGSGLTRATADAKQLGIISRQAVVTGSVPSDPAEVAAGDTVAYTGRVLVRLRGECVAGDYIVPSGLEDGTATSSRERKGPAMIGRALHACTASSDRLRTDSDAETDSDVCATEIQLVECTVVPPPNTVVDRLPWWESHSRGAFAAMAASCTIVLLVLVRMVVGLSSQITDAAGCVPLEAPAHMTISGDCDGAVGSRCVYERCEEGFVMQPSRQQQQQVSQAILPGTTRECLSAGTLYSGDPLVCVRAHCPETNVNCSSASGCCVNCGGEDVLATFPSTNVDPPSATSGGSADVDGTRAMTSTVPCPLTRIGEPTRGELTRMCISSTSSGKGGAWTPINGTCERMTCKPVTQYLAGFSMAMRSTETRNVASDDHALLFPESASGSGVFELPCPAKDYKGSMSLTCAAGSTEWSDPTGQCEWQHCVSREHNAGTAEHPVPMTLPDLSVGESVVMSCCSEFTVGGGCAHYYDGIGVITAQCVRAEDTAGTADNGGDDGDDTNAEYVFQTSGQCVPSDSFSLSLTASSNPGGSKTRSTTDSKNGTDLLRQLWTQFSSGLAGRISESTGGAWTLPEDGMLGMLNLRRDDEWVAVATSPRFTTGHEGSLGTRSANPRDGSRAVATANVACRELGFAGASVVGNCQGISALVKANEGRIDGSDELLAALCSESAGPVKVEIRADWDNYLDPRAPRVEWLPKESVDVFSEFVGPPPWLRPHVSWCVGDEIDGINHLSTPGRRCDLPGGSGGISGVCSSVSSGENVQHNSNSRHNTAGALARCLQYELDKFRDGPDPATVHRRAGRDKNTPRNNYNFVLGCTGFGEKPPLYPRVQIGPDEKMRQPGRSGGHGGGTWIVGDGIGKYGHDDVATPKIFSDTQPHLYSSHTNGNASDFARMEPASTAFYQRGKTEMTQLVLSDRNIAYPGRSSCGKGCAYVPRPEDSG